MKVIYPVLVYEEEKGYSACVPDIENQYDVNASTCGETLNDVLSMAEELIAGLVLDIIEENQKIPKASKIEDLSFEQYEKKMELEDYEYKSKFKTYIKVDINYYASKWGSKSMKKTVKIPKWLNTLAKEKGINFSETLEEALLYKIYDND